MTSTDVLGKDSVSLQQTTSQTSDNGASIYPPKISQTKKAVITHSGVTKDNWKQLIWYAKRQWYKLTEAELLKTTGDEGNLTNLLKDRYSLKHDEANRQVKDFLSNCISK